MGKTAVEKLLGGTLRADREPPQHTKPVGYTFPYAPRHLTGDHKKVWNDVKREMTKYGVITGADASILEQYCILMTSLRNDPGEFTASLHAQLRGLANDLLLTPESRRKAGVTDSSKETNDPYDI